MLLTYVDESGINYKKKPENSKQFLDGPVIVWCGLLIPEEKYFHLERLFYDLIKKKLKVKDWSDVEIHATEVWSRSGKFNSLTTKEVLGYFEELAQLIKKLDLKIIVGVKRKTINLKTGDSKNKEVAQTIFAFLHGLEHKLSELNETSIVISDVNNNENRISLLEKLYLERTQWRYNPGAKKTFSLKSKFDFESRACFFLDQIHHTNSKTSLFIQIVDNITYIIRRVMEHALYASDPSIGITPDKSYVPVTTNTFAWLSQNISMATFSKKDRTSDVYFTNLHEAVSRGDNYIHQFKDLIS